MSERESTLSPCACSGERYDAVPRTTVRPLTCRGVGIVMLRCWGWLTKAIVLRTPSFLATRHERMLYSSTRSAPMNASAVSIPSPRSAEASNSSGDAATNASIVRSVLNGDQGPQRDVVLLNAGAALFRG